MGAGPTRERIARVRRQILQKAARETQGTYVPGRGGLQPHVVTQNHVVLSISVMRASNGEAFPCRHARCGERTTAGVFEPWSDLIARVAP